MTVSVHDLELPEVELIDLERDEALAVLAKAREGHWLARTPMGYMVTRHEDVTAILRDRRFLSALSLITQMQGVDDSRFFARRRRSILSVDGDDHARLRRLVAPAFTPKSADRLRPFMRDVINGLVDDVATDGRCELVQDVCEPYPIPIVCELLGAPKEDWKLFSNWASDIFRIFNNDLENDMARIDAASDELDAYVRAMVDERRSRPADDLLSDLIAIEEEGDRLDTDDLVGLAEAVLMAGTDTTRNQLACSVALFTEHPDQWAMLAEQPDLARRAVEESMRYLGAVRGTMRIAGEDVEYRDVVFPAGTFVATSLTGANYDAATWDAPESFDITKERDATQMTFGSGIHFCLGASLARAELAEALPLLARRMPDLTVDGSIEWKPPTVGIWGPARLPLRFSPGN
ncbi:MAG TPA: cytochrome P450 [Acidimicrobiales bacterium]|jgi:cytochrome P450|nr:cytochrome P450 [Acidimicrobiales bacterium]